MNSRGPFERGQMERMRCAVPSVSFLLPVYTSQYYHGPSSDLSGEIYVEEKKNVYKVRVFAALEASEYLVVVVALEIRVKMMIVLMVLVLALVWDKAVFEMQVQGGLCGEEWNMVQKRGRGFEVNGSPYYVNGFNAYWLMVSAVDNSTRPKVTQVLQGAAAAGLTVGRTWAFNDGGWRALQISPGVYDENVFQALDFVIKEAKKNRIRLILSLSNNWNDYGGKAQYVKWGRSAGLNLTSDDDDAFFSHPTLRTYFKTHIKTVLTRANTLTNITYKDDPTIFGWELMNEPRCLSDPSGDTLQGWIQEMATYVKSIDPRHLLEIGSEGFYGPSTPDKFQFNPNTFSQLVGTDFVRNHGAFGIDFASAHIYADAWVSRVISPIYLSFVKNWTKVHIDDCQEKLNMPIIFVEYGLSDKDQGYNVSYRESFIQTVYDSVLESAQTGGAAGGALLWQLFAEGMENMDDGYEIVLSTAPSTTTHLMRRQSLQLDSLRRCT